MSISNERDFVVQLLGELLYVERRLADEVLQSLVDAVDDDGLRRLLETHRAETREHVERIETVFRRLGVAPTSNRCAQAEAAVDEHRALARSIVEPRLADLHHARVALQLEYWELAAYRMLLPLLSPEAADLLRPSYDEDRKAATELPTFGGGPVS